MVTHLNSCMIVLLLHSWISRAVGVGIDFCPWDDLCETLTQQQGHKSNRSHSLHRIISSWDPEMSLLRRKGQSYDGVHLNSEMQDKSDS